MKELNGTLMFLCIVIAMHGCSTIAAQTMHKSVVCEVRQ